jgi:hypothetical protein
MKYLVRKNTPRNNRRIEFGNGNSSNYVAGVPPVDGKNNIINFDENTGEPRFYVVDDEELVLLANQLGGGVSTTNNAKNFLRSRNDVQFTDGLDEPILHLDASMNGAFKGNSIWRDMSGNNNHCTLVNNASYNNIKGGAVRFDGNGDYVDLGQSYTLSRLDSTISAWVYIDDFNPAAPKTQPARNLINNSLAGEGYRNVIIFWDGEVGFESNTNSNPYELNSDVNGPVVASDVVPLSWFQFTISFISGVANFYVNGNFLDNVSVGNDTIVRYLGGTGTRSNYPDWMKGYISEFVIRDRGLTADEVLSNYNVTKGRYE